MITPLGKTEFSHGSPTATRGTLRVSETFCSRQGEGILTGTESFFIRTSGCNLRCWFCDTPYASWSPQGENLPVDAIVEQYSASGLGHVVLTGGEPMLPRDVVILSRELRRAGAHITIETAGTVDREVACDLMSISPKFESSAPRRTGFTSDEQHLRWHALHQKRRRPFETMKRLIARVQTHQLKFVVDSPDDYPELIEIVERTGVERSHVWVMPQGSTNEAMDAALAWLQPWSIQNGFQYCDRMQIRWFGNRRGT